MKYALFFFLLLFIYSCSNKSEDTETLQAKIDSLQNKLDNAYTPGFGEFMSNVQAHHIKLWYAGKYQNWRLADFEVHEIMESIDDIRNYQQERPESKEIDMIDSALDSVNIAIQKQDTLLFQKHYTELTNTCNECHQLVHFDFNVVKIPDSQPFSNQSFKLPNK